MTIIACGINHRTAPIHIRESLSFVPEAITAPLQELTQQQGISEAAILSTCNRTEIYGYAPHNAQAILAWLQHKSPLATSEDYFYCYQDAEAIQHMMRVASGLDSMMLGEPQILGQLKTAYNQAQQAGTLGKELDRLFQYVFSVTKQVRNSSGIGTNPLSIAVVSVNLTQKIFSDLNKTHALLLGAGETIDLIAYHLRNKGIRQLTIANRSQRRAAEIAERHQAQTINLNSLPDFLPQADLIISATSSPLPLIGKGSVQTACKKRRHRPMIILDLAVPRDVEAEVAELDDVFLYNIDHLQTMIQHSWQQRQQAAFKAEDMIQAHADYFMRWLKSLDANQLIQQYRQQHHDITEQELQKACWQLAHGDDPKFVLQRFAKRLSNKLMHKPTIKMREASFSGQLELLDLIKRLHDLT